MFFKKSPLTLSDAFGSFTHHHFPPLKAQPLVDGNVEKQGGTPIVKLPVFVKAFFQKIKTGVSPKTLIGAGCRTHAPPL